MGHGLAPFGVSRPFSSRIELPSPLARRGSPDPSRFWGGRRGPNLATISSRGSMIHPPFAFGFPTLQNGVDIPPATFILSNGLAERLLNPACGVVVGGIAQFLGHHRQQQPNILLIERKDVGALPFQRHLRRPGKRPRPPG